MKQRLLNHIQRRRKGIWSSHMSFEVVPKMLYRIKFWRLNCPVHLFQILIPKIFLHKPSMVMSNIIIHENEFLTNSNNIWSGTRIKDLFSLSLSHESSSMEYIEVSLTNKADASPNNDSSSWVTVHFKNTGLMLFGASFSPYQHTTQINFKSKFGFIDKDCRIPLLFDPDLVQRTFLSNFNGSFCVFE